MARARARGLFIYVTGFSERQKPRLLGGRYRCAYQHGACILLISPPLVAQSTCQKGRRRKGQLMDIYIVVVLTVRELLKKLAVGAVLA